MRVPFSLILLLQFQATQLTHFFEESQKEVAKDAEWRKVLKDVAATIAKEKGKAAEKKAKSSEKAWLVVENKLAEVETKLGGMELKLAEDESLNLAHVDEIADKKVALKTCENKWYNEGFMDAKNSVEPIVHQARSYGFGEGWLVALQVMGVLEDSLLRNPEQIPYLAPSPHPLPLPLPLPPTFRVRLMQLMKKTPLV